MNKEDIPFLSATELSHKLENKEVSPVEATEAYLERIDAVDSKLNSYITVCRDEALRDAADAEKAIARGDYKGPMHGVPVAVKDQIWTKGIRTTVGSRLLADFVPNEDATVVTKLKEAGAILLGKLNMSEFACGPTHDQAFGLPHNPWNLERSPGGSSSGSGAATAAFLCATSLGEDTGGSVRGPATSCGLVGIRPTHGMVSRHGVFGLSWSMDIVGPISRTVADCAMTLEAIAGYDPKDMYTWKTPVPHYQKALDGDIKGVKVGVLNELIQSEVVEPDVRNAVLNAVGVLGELGAEMEEASLSLSMYSGISFAALWAPEGAALYRKYITEQLDKYDYNTQVQLLVGALIPAQTYLKAQKLRDLIRRQVLEALTKVDVLVLPTTPSPANKVPSEHPKVSSKEQVKKGYWGRRGFTNPFSLANVPALSVPCGFTADGLPVGLQIVGRPFEEELVFKVAHAYEQSTPWHKRRPPI